MKLEVPDEDVNQAFARIKAIFNFGDESAIVSLNVASYSNLHRICKMIFGPKEKAVAQVSIFCEKLPGNIWRTAAIVDRYDVTGYRNVNTEMIIEEGQDFDYAINKAIEFMHLASNLGKIKEEN